MLREALDRFHRGTVYSELISGPAQHDREIAHERALNWMERYLERNLLVLRIMDRYLTYQDPLLRTRAFGLHFRNPLGMAAGFDKNFRVFKTLASLGFGHVEGGSVTTLQYDGNPRSRIFSLPEDDAVINRMGFPGDGLDVVEPRLRKKVVPRSKRNYVLGVNMGASKPSFERGTAIEDIREAHRRLQGLGDYKVDNVSSPNTPGVRGLQEPEVLEDLLSATDEFHSQDRLGANWEPRLLKLSPDLEPAQIDAILDVALKHRVHGVVVTNTTTNSEIRQTLKGVHRSQGGGISGRPLTARALAVSRYVYDVTDGELPIIRAGGVVTPEDYWEAIAFGGADLVQIYTAFVNHKTSTPNIAYYFNKYLATRMRQEGVRSLDEMRGKSMLPTVALNL